jgi:hypothetical protein
VSERSIKAQIESLSAQAYKTAFTHLHDQLSKTDWLMLKDNYQSPDHTTTATRLARAAGFPSFHAANLRYGLLARKLCDYFQIYPQFHSSILVIFEKPGREWQAVLRPQVVQALEELEWFASPHPPNVLGELEQHKATYETLDRATRQAIIDSRMGQGSFRSALVEYWNGCAVTGCQAIELLHSSHIKPWKTSTNTERLDPYNGLLLLPNLQTAFQQGFITFQNDGTILISSRLTEEAQLQLGLNHTLRLRFLESPHLPYLQFHSETLFIP